MGVEYIGCIGYANGTGGDYNSAVTIAGNNHNFFVGSGCLCSGCISIADLTLNPNTHTGFKCNAGGYAKFINCYDYGSQYGFRFDNVNGASIISSYTKDNALSGIGTYNCSKVFVDGLEIRTPSSYGAKIGAYGSGSSDCYFNMHIINPGGSRAISSFDSVNCVHTGTIRTSNAYGVYIYGCDDIVIRDMDFDMDGSTGRAISLGTDILSPMDIHNVTIRDRSATCEYGIYNGSTTIIYPYISNVDMQGITTKYYACGDGTGSTSISDGGSILHYLPATPTWVQVTPTVSGEMCSVTDSTTGHFHVAIKKHDNSAGTAQTVYWKAKIL
jgi:hypothetical protein